MGLHAHGEQRWTPSSLHRRPAARFVLVRDCTLHDTPTQPGAHPPLQTQLASDVACKRYVCVQVALCALGRRWAAAAVPPSRHDAALCDPASVILLAQSARFGAGGRGGRAVEGLGHRNYPAARRAQVGRNPIFEDTRPDHSCTFSTAQAARTSSAAQEAQRQRTRADDDRLGAELDLNSYLHAIHHLRTQSISTVDSHGEGCIREGLSRRSLAGIRNRPALLLRSMSLAATGSL